MFFWSVAFLTTRYMGWNKQTKKETHKLNVHGIVPGFGVILFMRFLPQKEWPQKHTHTQKKN